MSADAASALTPNDASVVLLAKISLDLGNIERKAKWYNKLSMVVKVVGLVCGILATAMATSAAGIGSPMAHAVSSSTHQVGNAVPGWRLICGIVGAFACISTICYQLHSTLKIEEHVTRFSKCSGLLRALVISCEGKNAVTEAQLEKVKKEYGAIAESFPDCWVW